MTAVAKNILERNRTLSSFDLCGDLEKARDELRLLYCPPPALLPDLSLAPHVEIRCLRAWVESAAKCPLAALSCACGILLCSFRESNTLL